MKKVTLIIMAGLIGGYLLASDVFKFHSRGEAKTIMTYKPEEMRIIIYLDTICRENGYERVEDEK